jgi:hypothetical protein
MEYTQTGVNRALKDIRPRAEERARRRQEEAQRPPGTGFMSERTRAKEALRVEVNTYTGENARKMRTLMRGKESFFIYSRSAQKFKKTRRPRIRVLTALVLLPLVIS